MRQRALPLFQLLSRLPASVWLRGIAALLVIFVLATFGLALLAGVAAVVLLGVLGFKLREWLGRMFGRRGVDTPANRGARVFDAEYVIVDRRNERR